MTEAENKVRLARQMVRAAVEFLELAMMEDAGSLSSPSLNHVDSALSDLRDVNLDLLMAERHELSAEVVA